MAEQFTAPIHLRRDYFDPAPELSQLRTWRSLPRVPMPWGVDAWLVTRYADVKAVLGDESTFDIDTSSIAQIGITHPENMESEPEAEDKAEAEALTHAKMRRLLLPEFTPRRARELAPKIEAIVAEHLDKLADASPPADLVTCFARPIPLLVIGELLGIPTEDRAEFRRWNTVRLDTTATPEAQAEAVRECHAHMAELVGKLRASGGDGILGRLISEHGHEFSDAHLSGMVDVLLLAGYESTAAMIGLGTLLLLRNPEQRPWVLNDRTADVAIEEMLRYLAVSHTVMPRVAVRDTVIGDTRIAAGEIVMCSLPAANRDPDLVADPDRLDLTREPTVHMSFGHGMRSCFGAPLARTQMRCAYQGLFRRFPELRLAVSAEEVRFQKASIAYSVASLPVIW